MEWKTIDSAPKDGRGLVVGWKSENGNWNYRIAYYGENNEWVVACTIFTVKPTHYHDLLTPPE